MFKHCFTFSLIMLFATAVAGQGWERVYGGGGLDQINAIAPTPDGGFVMTGFYGLGQVYLLKTDADGNFQWSKNFSLGPEAAGTAVIATQDTGYAVAGYRSMGNQNNDVYLFKTDAYGKVLWETSYGNALNRGDEATGLVELPDGSLVVSGFTTNHYIPVTNEYTEDILVLKTDKNGNQIWAKTYGQQAYKEKGNAITLATNGDLVIAGSFREQTAMPGDIDFYAVRISSSDGAEQWHNTYGFNGLDDNAKAIAPSTDGNFVLAGRTLFGQGSAGFLMKINGNGSSLFLWQKTFPKTDFNGLSADKNGGFFASGYKDVTDAQGDLYIARISAEGDKMCDAVVGKAGPDASLGVIATADGGAAAAGYSYPFFNGSESNAYLVKADLNCLVFTSYIKGNIFRDLNANCLPDNGETGLEDFIVSIVSPNFSRYAVANKDGDFRLAVDTGHYDIKLFPPNEYWRACTNVTKVVVPAFYDTVETTIPVQRLFACPHNEVDIATPILRRCADNTYTVRYCNSGPESSLNTRVEVAFDPALTVTGSSIFGFESPAGSNNYVYNVGTLESGECKTFTVTALLDCAITTGQTFCVSAHIYPDSLCNPGNNWNGSIIGARARCDGDTVRMYLRNKTQNPMINELGYVIADDLVMLTAPGDPNFQFKLSASQDTNIWSHPADNHTYRIIAQQSPGYPGAGYPTAAIEGCKTDTSTNPISLGYYTMFPEDDADAFVESDCQESYETDYNPTYLKRGHPKGYDVAHYVSPETDLDYLIQFRNTGTDTVHQIIIRDTLSPALDPATVHPGAASHAYDFEVYGQGIVQFTLPNVNLAPGSSASEGFVKFRVSQKPNIECETKILNSAAIYFDFNAPVITNETYHTICVDYIVATINPEFPGADLQVYPNPFVESTTFEVTGVQAHTYGLHLYDAQGRLLSNSFFNLPTYRLYRHQLPAGVIFYRLTADGKPVASGKLIAQ
ncbi:MAG: T9SS type A sorting domain-containing protein [Lewinellaceae bacterium]|nr:T9SS type A sorting domain-containing protein [Lewinellaceae bacterium]